jgi:vacuolar-type H+-ATPase subunit C/Vma6
VSPGLEYAVVRSHALISSLLTPEQIRGLAYSETLEEFIQRLSETPYGVVSPEAGINPSIALERVFYRKFIERMAGVVELAPGKMAEFLRAYYYLRFEVLNLKRILRGKYSFMPPGQILESLVPIEPYMAGSYEALAEAESLERAVEMLAATPYSRLMESMELYRKLDAVWPLELALNHIYASATLKSLEALPHWDRVLVRWIVELETDVENLLAALKRRGLPLPAPLEELFPATFRIGLDEIRMVMESRDLRSAISSLGPPYSEILSPIYEGDVALIRTRTREQMYMAARRGRSLNDFGFNVIMAYLVFSEVEKGDLVGIAWGKAQRIPPEQILKYLVIPNI